MAWLDSEGALDRSAAPWNRATAERVAAYVSQTHLGCSTARNKGTCDNLRGIKRATLEDYVLGGLRHHLMDPDLAKVFAEEYSRHLNTLRKTKNAWIERDRAELTKIIGEQEKLVDAICDGVPARKLKDRMITLEERQQDLEHKLAAAKEDPIQIGRASCRERV